jgi:hypothetical protein
LKKTKAVMKQPVLCLWIGGIALLGTLTYMAFTSTVLGAIAMALFCLLFIGPLYWGVFRDNRRQIAELEASLKKAEK